MTAPEEWHGETHTLIVHSVRLPDGPLDDGGLEYDIEHPPSCKEERRGGSEHYYMAYTCDVASNEESTGLAFSLRYSGTPVTEPGTYRIQAWGRKAYVWDAWGYEYDGGVSLVDEEDES